MQVKLGINQFKYLRQQFIELAKKRDQERLLQKQRRLRRQETVQRTSIPKPSLRFGQDEYRSSDAYFKKIRLQCSTALRLGLQNLTLLNNKWLMFRQLQQRLAMHAPRFCMILAQRKRRKSFQYYKLRQKKLLQKQHHDKQERASMHLKQ